EGQRRGRRQRGEARVVLVGLGAVKFGHVRLAPTLPRVRGASSPLSPRGRGGLAPTSVPRGEGEERPPRGLSPSGGRTGSRIRNRTSGFSCPLCSPSELAATSSRRTRRRKWGQERATSAGITTKRGSSWGERRSSSSQ